MSLLNFIFGTTALDRLKYLFPPAVEYQWSLNTPPVPRAPVKPYRAVWHRNVLDADGEVFGYVVHNGKIAYWTQVFSTYIQESRPKTTFGNGYFRKLDSYPMP